MTIKEMEAKLAHEGLLEAHVGMNLKKYVNGELIYRDSQWDNCVDVFGICRGEDGSYCFFITESERGIPLYTDVYTTENEACDALIKKISRGEKIYQEKMMRK